MSLDKTLTIQINIKLKISFVQNFMGFQHCNAKFSTATNKKATKIKA